MIYVTLTFGLMINLIIVRLIGFWIMIGIAEPFFRPIQWSLNKKKEKKKERTRQERAGQPGKPICKINIMWVKHSILCWYELIIGFFIYSNRIYYELVDRQRSIIVVMAQL